MATYAIGDVQGCVGALEALLLKISFDAKRDTLWFTGDIVNRGPDSLATLRLIKSLGEHHKIVLGNHDLHLLGVAFGVANVKKGDTLDEILSAPDRSELIEWLRHRPLLVHDEIKNCVMSHAGVAPAWRVEKAVALAREVEAVLRGPHAATLLKEMYGNEPSRWEEALEGMDRLRCIINYLTRMRYCYADGRMALDFKGARDAAPPELLPWFLVNPRANAETNLIFGHWAALNGECEVSRVFALDTGCVWGNRLTAMRLEDKARFSVGCV